MEIRLINHTGSNSTKKFSSGGMIVKVEVNRGEYESVTIRGSSMHEEYRKKVVAVLNNYFKTTGRSLCIHIMKDLNNPGNAVECFVRVHGFLWENLDELWMEGLKIRLQLSFNIYSGSIASQHHPPLLSVDIPISRLMVSSGFPIDPTNEACLNGGHFSEIKDVTFYHVPLIHHKFGDNPTIKVLECVSLICEDSVHAISSNTGGEATGEITPIPDTEALATTRITRKILHSKIHSDFAIVANDGSSFPCNKNFLAAHSPVFEKDLKEVETKEITIKFMTPDGVKALLDYIYTFELDKAIENCDIALQLLQAGHKYEIKSLEKQVSSVLLKKEAEWFKSDMALGLFLFARKVEPTVSVLMANPNKFLDSACFKNMQQENPLESSDTLAELIRLSHLN